MRSRQCLRKALVNATARRAHRESGSAPRRGFAREEARVNALVERKPTRAPISPIGSCVFSSRSRASSSRACATAHETRPLRDAAACAVSSATSRSARGRCSISVSDVRSQSRTLLDRRAERRAGAHALARGVGRLTLDVRERRVVALERRVEARGAQHDAVACGIERHRRAEEIAPSATVGANAPPTNAASSDPHVRIGLSAKRTTRSRNSRTRCWRGLPSPSFTYSSAIASPVSCAKSQSTLPISSR